MDTLYLKCAALHHAVWSKRFTKLEEMEDEKHGKLTKLLENAKNEDYLNSQQSAIVEARAEIIKILHKERVRNIRKLWAEEDKHIFDEACPSTGPVKYTPDHVIYNK
jgi:hypothetical protein